MSLKEFLQEMEEWKNTLLYSPEEVEHLDEGEVYELVELCQEIIDSRG